MSKDYRIKYDRSLHRFVVVGLEGDVLDDANGHGYKTAHAAHRGYGFIQHCWRRGISFNERTRELAEVR